LTTTQPDPKPAKRIRDPNAAVEKLLRDRVCRSCGEWATEGHHIVHRSLGGDDVTANIMPLCRKCHRRYHDGVSLIVELADDELLYVGEKMGAEGGAEYVRRRYGLVS